jgi:hypothetical protein
MRALIARHVIMGCPILWVFLPACFSSSTSDESAGKHLRLIPGLAALDQPLLAAEFGQTA